SRSGVFGTDSSLNANFGDSAKQLKRQTSSCGGAILNYPYSIRLTLCCSFSLTRYSAVLNAFGKKLWLDRTKNVRPFRRLNWNQRCRVPFGLFQTSKFGPRLKGSFSTQHGCWTNAEDGAKQRSPR